MITIKDIIDNAKPHPSRISGAKQTRLFNSSLEVSIVGGGSGLYGNFEDTFELAVFDRNTKDFVTKFFFPENNDDVIGYMEVDDLVNFLNKIFHSGFQVR